jgi:protein-tyrosine-phosphatase
VTPTWSDDRYLLARARVHAALGEPARLAIVDDLATSDRSPKELGERLAMPSNLLAHHLEVLERVGLIARSASAGDGRRKYVRLVHDRVPGRADARLTGGGTTVHRDMLFLCTHNSARSQLAAALWMARAGGRASSAGTRPAGRVHRGAVAAARRAGLSLSDAVPTAVGEMPADAQVVTVCDLVHEELEARPDWWHWSIADPVPAGDARAFDAVVSELDSRIASVLQADEQRGPR